MNLKTFSLLFVACGGAAIQTRQHVSVLCMDKLVCDYKSRYDYPLPLPNKKVIYLAKTTIEDDSDLARVEITGNQMSYGGRNGIYVTDDTSLVVNNISTWHSSKPIEPETPGTDECVVQDGKTVCGPEPKN